MSGPEAGAFYTRYARLYDRIATDAPFVSGLRERVVDALDPGRGDVVVEMGCGTGVNLPSLRQRVGDGGIVIGIDLSAGVIGRARERVERNGWRNVHVVRADATRSPFGSVTGPGNVDCVLATFLTGMLVDPAAAVDDWCRLLADPRRPNRTPGARGRICVAGLARSTRPVGRLLNPAFAAGVGLAAPPGSTDDTGGESAVDRLDRRAFAAHHRVHSRCADAETTRSLAGFARITAGSVDVRPEHGDDDDHDFR